MAGADADATVRRLGGGRITLAGQIVGGAGDQAAGLSVAELLSEVRYGGKDNGQPENPEQADGQPHEEEESVFHRATSFAWRTLFRIELLRR